MSFGGCGVHVKDSGGCIIGRESLWSLLGERFGGGNLTVRASGRRNKRHGLGKREGDLTIVREPEQAPYADMVLNPMYEVHEFPHLFNSILALAVHHLH